MALGARQLVRTARGYILAVASVAVIAAVLLPLRTILPAEVFMLLFVPVVVAVARLGGFRVAATTAIAAFLALDFLFIRPYYTFTVEPLSLWFALLAFLAVSIVTGRQTVALRQRERAAVERQRELELLNDASFRAASEDSPHALAVFVAGQVIDVLGAMRAALYAAHDASAPALLAAAGAFAGEEDERDIVAWVQREGKAVGVPPEALPLGQRPIVASMQEVRPGSSARGAFLPLQTSQGIEGVLVALPSHPGRVRGGEARILVALANLSAASLERQRLAGEAAHAEALREAEQLKTTLVSSVSHELKTPLAAATARVTGLMEVGALDDTERARTQLGAVERDLGRLDASIGDLLDISRLESAAWQPRREPLEVREILGAMLARLPVEAQRRVTFDITDHVPEVCVDGPQLVRAIRNVAENALAYSPEDSPVWVSASATTGGDAEIAVRDRGPGIPDAEKARVFEKFYRGSAASRTPHGSGLGMTIASEIVRSNDGSIRIEDAAPHGVRVVIVLPAKERSRG